MEQSHQDSTVLTVVVGPTASGKSELAMRLAESSGAEIIGADSVQIYRHFDIGSGKPTAEDRRRVPHHLVDAIEPEKPIDAAEYARLADTAIDDIVGRGKTPIVCGGTFLWIKALVWGLSGAPPADPGVRLRHGEIVAEHGRARLHAELARVDPQTAARLAPNDFVRVSRALEVWELSGRPMSAWHEAHGFRESRRRARLVGIRWSPEALTTRISARTRQLLAAGWVSEVRGLVGRGLRDARAMGSVGYRQVLEHVEGRLPKEELAPAIDRATRVFARRQRTWLRDQSVEWIEGGV